MPSRYFGKSLNSNRHVDFWLDSDNDSDTSFTKITRPHTDRELSYQTSLARADSYNSRPSEYQYPRRKRSTLARRGMTNIYDEKDYYHSSTELESYKPHYQRYTNPEDTYEKPVRSQTVSYKLADRYSDLYDKDSRDRYHSSTRDNHYYYEDPTREKLETPPRDLYVKYSHSRPVGDKFISSSRDTYGTYEYETVENNKPNSSSRSIYLEYKHSTPEKERITSVTTRKSIGDDDFSINLSRETKHLDPPKESHLEYDYDLREWVKPKKRLTETKYTTYRHVIPPKRKEWWEY